MSADTVATVETKHAQAANQREWHARKGFVADFGNFINFGTLVA